MSEAPAGACASNIWSGLFQTADIAGTGGRLKASPEDFMVEELPAYEPRGEGEHLFLFIEKRGATTGRAIEWLSERLRTPRSAFGYAGMKDREAVTRQWLSIHDPHGELREEEVEQIESEWLRVLEAARHENKLRLGHLRGNRFRIRIRDVGLGAAPRALRVLRILEERGAPNFFGPQRYGSRGVNHLIGRAIIRGRFDEALHELLGMSTAEDESRRDSDARRCFLSSDFRGAIKAFPRSAAAERKTLEQLRRGASAEEALRAVSQIERNFWLSGFQSAVFDDVLQTRMARGLMSELLPGDVAIKHDNGALFDVPTGEVGAQLSKRAASFEISPTGPLWGSAMKTPTGEPLRLEVEALERAGVSVEELSRFAESWGELGLGARRALRLKLSEPDVEAGVDERGEYVECRFALPAGGFATVVMNEIMKNEEQERRPW